MRVCVLHLLSVEWCGDSIAVQLTPHCGSSYQNVFLAVVLRQRRLAAKALATSVNHALVRSLASVDATMACQGTAVAESLLAFWKFAHVWSLSSVSTLVDRKGGALNKRLCATKFGTEEGSIVPNTMCMSNMFTKSSYLEPHTNTSRDELLPFVGVDASMASQVGPARERFATMHPCAEERSRIVMMALRMDEFENVHRGRKSQRSNGGKPQWQ